MMYEIRANTNHTKILEADILKGAFSGGVEIVRHPHVDVFEVLRFGVV